MIRLRRAPLALLLITVAAGGALAQPKFDLKSTTDESRGDALSNPALKGPQVLTFMGLKRGDRVADIIPGRFTTAFAAAVGPKGRVYDVMPTEIIKFHPEIAAAIEGHKSQPAYANVEFSTPAINDMVLPNRLDAVFIRQNYHDLHVRFMGPADVPAFNRKVFAALKPGGVYVIIDHVASPGMDLTTATNRFHRIDPATVKAEVEAASFKLDGESDLLADKTDAHDKMVLETSILGKTDQFLLRFRKPK